MDQGCLSSGSLLEREDILSWLGLGANALRWLETVRSLEERWEEITLQVFERGLGKGAVLRERRLFPAESYTVIGW